MSKPKESIEIVISQGLFFLQLINPVENYSMNRVVTALAIASTLFLAQACSSPTKQEGASTQTQPQNNHTGQKHDSKNHTTQKRLAGDSNSGHHNDSSHGIEASTPSQTTQAKLTAPSQVTPNQPVDLVIDIQDSAGKAVSQFDMFQEKLMHLIIVSDDLQFFDHIHPEYKENGRFEIKANFPKPGGYTLFSDYKPAGQVEQVSVLKTGVSGTKLAASPPSELNRTKTIGNTRIKLTFAQPTPKAGEEQMLMFDLTDTTSNKPVTDLQPYLGETGHLVIVKQSSSLAREDYIHAHTHAMQSIPEGQIHFMTQFPKPGKYKLWGQFNRNGQIITADFWVDVL